MAGSDLRVARRYAAALFRVARGRNEIDPVADSLAIVTDVATRSPELMTVLHHPRISRERKKQLLEQIFANAIRPDVEHFLMLLIEKDRAAIIPNVAAQFARLVDEHRHETDGEAITAVPLTDAQRAALQQRLEAATGYTVRLKTRVDENILGGLVVRVGDKLIDGSVAAQLQAMREQLRRVKVT